MSNFISSESDLQAFLSENPTYHAISQESIESNSYTSNFDQTIQKCNELIDIIDDESTPYKSKYQARELLLELSKEIESLYVIQQIQPKTVSNIEKLKDLKSKFISIKVFLGSIDYEVNELYDCEKELICFVQEFSYDLFIFADQMKDINKDTSKDVNLDSSYRYPHMNTLIESTIRYQLVDIFKGFNMLGILYTSYEQIEKAMLYLFINYYLFHSLNESQRTIEIDDLYTHTIYYIAQVFGLKNDILNSCRYCHETLQRQYASYTNNCTILITSNLYLILEWIRNLIHLSRFYLTIKFYRTGYLSLYIALYVLRNHQDHAMMTNDIMKEYKALIHQQFVELYELLMKLVYQSQLLIQDDEDIHLEESFQKEYQDIEYSSENDEELITNSTPCKLT